MGVRFFRIPRVEPRKTSEMEGLTPLGNQYSTSQSGGSALLIIRARRSFRHQFCSDPPSAGRALGVTEPVYLGGKPQYCSALFLLRRLPTEFIRRKQ